MYAGPPPIAIALAATRPYSGSLAGWQAGTRRIPSGTCAGCCAAMPAVTTALIPTLIPTSIPAIFERLRVMCGSDVRRILPPAFDTTRDEMATASRGILPTHDQEFLPRRRRAFFRHHGRSGRRPGPRWD